MKYLIKYFPFFEGAIPKGTGGALSMAQSLGRYLEHSPAMLDIKALVSKGRIRPTKTEGEEVNKPLHWRKRDDSDEANRIKEPMSYVLKKNGDIYFDKRASYRYFGQEAYLIRQENNTYTLKIEENSKLTFEQNYENIEDGLRNVWAFFVSRTKEYTVSTKYVQEITRKFLIDPSKHLFWGEKKTAVEIIQELGIKSLDAEEGEESPINMGNVNHLLNETFRILGMSFQLIGKHAIRIPTKFGVMIGQQDNLLSLILRGLFNTNSNDGGTYEPAPPTDEKQAKKHINGVRTIYPLTRFDDDQGKKGIYYIQPRTTEEAFIQCLVKVCKVYYKHYRDYKFTNLQYGGESIENTSIRLFIYNYSSILVNEVSKKGIEILNDEEIYYKAIFAAITKGEDNTVYELANIIKKNAPTFWEKVSSYDVSGMESAADMGDMGFADD